MEEMRIYVVRCSDRPFDMHFDDLASALRYATQHKGWKIYLDSMKEGLILITEEGKKGD